MQVAQDYTNNHTATLAAFCDIYNQEREEKRGHLPSNIPNRHTVCPSILDVLMS